MIAESVKRLRLERAWTQEHLAEAAGLSPRTVQRLEQGERPSLETLNALAAALGVDVAGLRGEAIARPLAERALSSSPRARFHRHLLVYVVVMSGLAGLDIVTSPDHLWFFYPLLGWGLGVALHARKVFALGWAGAGSEETP